MSEGLRLRRGFAQAPTGTAPPSDMSPAQYDAWYRTPRGAWIGETEHRLLREALAPLPDETLIDIGCGTGYFTRRFTRDGLPVTGLDLDPQMLDFAGRTPRPASAPVRLTPDACRSPTAASISASQSRRCASSAKSRRRSPRCCA